MKTADIVLILGLFLTIIFVSICGENFLIETKKNNKIKNPGDIDELLDYDYQVRKLYYQLSNKKFSHSQIDPEKQVRKSPTPTPTPTPTPGPNPTPTPTPTPTPWPSGDSGSSNFILFNYNNRI